MSVLAEEVSHTKVPSHRGIAVTIGNGQNYETMEMIGIIKEIGKYANSM